MIIIITSKPCKWMVEHFKMCCADQVAMVRVWVDILCTWLTLSDQRDVQRLVLKEWQCQPCENSHHSN